MSISPRTALRQATLALGAATLLSACADGHNAPPPAAHPSANSPAQTTPPPEPLIYIGRACGISVTGTNPASYAFNRSIGGDSDAVALAMVKCPDLSAFKEMLLLRAPSDRKTVVDALPPRDRTIVKLGWFK